jgi:hypothetical protein
VSPVIPSSLTPLSLTQSAPKKKRTSISDVIQPLVGAKPKGKAPLKAKLNMKALSTIDDSSDSAKPKGKAPLKAKLNMKALFTIDDSSDSDVTVVGVAPGRKKARVVDPKPVVNDDYVVSDGRLEIMVGKCIAVQPNLEPLVTRDDKTKKIFEVAGTSFIRGVIRSVVYKIETPVAPPAPPVQPGEKKKRQKKPKAIPIPIFEIGWCDTIFKDEKSKLPLHVVLPGMI